MGNFVVVAFSLWLAVAANNTRFCCVHVML